MKNDCNNIYLIAITTPLNTKQRSHISLKSLSHLTPWHGRDPLPRGRVGPPVERGLRDLVLRPHLDLGEGHPLGHRRDGRLLLGDLLAEAADLAFAALTALRIKEEGVMIVA